MGRCKTDTCLSVTGSRDSAKRERGLPLRKLAHVLAVVNATASRYIPGPLIVAQICARDLFGYELHISGTNPYFYSMKKKYARMTGAARACPHPDLPASPAHTQTCTLVRGQPASAFPAGDSVVGLKMAGEKTPVANQRPAHGAKSRQTACSNPSGCTADLPYVVLVSPNCEALVERAWFNKAPCIHKAL